MSTDKFFPVDLPISLYLSILCIKYLIMYELFNILFYIVNIQHLNIQINLLVLYKYFIYVVQLFNLCCIFILFML